MKNENFEMCINESCDMRNLCLRYRSYPNEFYQKYGDFDPGSRSACKSFITVIIDKLGNEMDGLIPIQPANYYNTVCNRCKFTLRSCRCVLTRDNNSFFKSLKEK